jgi:hypothetical protein
MFLLMNINNTACILLTSVYIASEVPDESAFTLSSDGLLLVYRPLGECYTSQYILTSTCSGCVFVHCYDWISHEGAGILQYLDGLQHKHILNHIVVPSVRMICSIVVTQFQRTTSPFMIVMWLKNGYCGRQMLWTHWLAPQAHAMNPIENK